MIVGLGNDLCEISRVQKVLDHYGERFTNRCFTDIERAKSDRRAQRAASYAKRFAAKEACSKALGTGISWGVYWRDMGVVNLPGGKPTLKLTGGALARLNAITPPGHKAQIDLSITVDITAGDRGRSRSGSKTHRRLESAVAVALEHAEAVAQIVGGGQIQVAVGVEIAGGNGGWPTASGKKRWRQE